MNQMKGFMEFQDGNRHMTVCAWCGYRFERGDEALRVKDTGDIIHKDCWMEYSDDNVQELTSEIEF